MRLLPVGPGDERRRAARREAEPERRRHRRRDGRQHLPLRHLPAHPRRDQACGEGARMKNIINVSRRDFFKASGALVLAVALPDALAQELRLHKAFSPNAFVRISSDNTVTVIVKHLEMAQGTHTVLPTPTPSDLTANTPH